MIKRIGNWYSVELDGVVYNVLVQRKNETECDPSTILVFDEKMDMVEDYGIWDRIEYDILENIEWESRTFNK